MKLKALKNRKALMDRNTKGPILYVAYNRRMKMYYVGVTSKTFNERYARRDYKHHFSNAFYCDPTAFDIYIYKFKTFGTNCNAKISVDLSLGNMYVLNIYGT